jgi:hypothetical protein
MLNDDSISGLWAVAMIPLLAGKGSSAISGESLRRQKLKQNIAKETRCKLLNAD